MNKTKTFRKTGRKTGKRKSKKTVRRTGRKLVRGGAAEEIQNETDLKNSKDWKPSKYIVYYINDIMIKNNEGNRVAETFQPYYHLDTRQERDLLYYINRPQEFKVYASP